MSVTTVVRDGLLRIGLNLSASGNKLTFEDGTALLGAFEAMRSLDEVKVALLEGGEVFCAGQAGGLPPELARLQASKPLVAGVQGTVLGIGVGLLGAAHVVVAAQGTSFGLTEIRTGGWPLMFDRIAAEIGTRRARELAMTGRVFGTPDAVQFGLVQEVAPAFEFDDRAEALAIHLSRLDLPLSSIVL